jgi:Fur family ferric uptake transcriptional regulator
MASQLEKTCRARELKLSEQRSLLLEMLDQSDSHLSAEEIWDRAVWRDRNVSLPTVYRLLGRLVEMGLLSRLQLNDGITRYERVRSDRHDHLIDVKEKTVLEFREPAIEALIRKTAAQVGYRLLEYRLELLAEPSRNSDAS